MLQWLRRKNVDFPSDTDAGPTASLRCSHGNLLPEQAPAAKRVLVPERLWLFFLEFSASSKSDGSLGFSTFSSESEPCETCSKELKNVACLEDDLRLLKAFVLLYLVEVVYSWQFIACCRASKLQQRQNHEKLIMGKGFPLFPSLKYYLVPSSWLTEWKAYLIATGKNISSCAKPENLEVIIDSLICQKVVI